MALKRGTIAPIVLGVVGTVVLAMLGAWQLQRMGEKEAFIAEIEARMTADPVAIPSTPTEAEHHRLRVATTGRVGRRELHVLTSIKNVGPGFRVIAPMELGEEANSAGRTIMVDLGFVPEAQKSASTRTEGSPRWRKRLFRDQVTGLLYWPAEVDGFTPDPDIDGNLWFARDVAAMAEVLGTEPVLLVAETHPESDAGLRWPLPRPPGVDVPNRHLEYVLTWFGLAIVWAVMSVFWLRSEMRKARRN